MSLVADIWPAAFDAVTVTLTGCPTSAGESMSVLPVWPSDHWYEKLMGLSPDHVPGSAVSSSPCCATPEIVGNALFDGGVAAYATPAANHQVIAAVSTNDDMRRRGPPLRRAQHRLSRCTRYRSHARPPGTPAIEAWTMIPPWPSPGSSTWRLGSHLDYWPLVWGMPSAITGSTVSCRVQEPRDSPGACMRSVRFGAWQAPLYVPGRHIQRRLGNAPHQELICARRRGFPFS